MKRIQFIGFTWFGIVLLHPFVYLFLSKLTGAFPLSLVLTSISIFIVFIIILSFGSKYVKND
ncbi:hypothetical protein [Tenacibaculum xiamenense]|uniref:hypothetical protein n=1 Tax=Tenacibaculum xiamenense TaxID=1261553 RepID=UPI0038B4AD38